MKKITILAIMIAFGFAAACSSVDRSMAGGSVGNVTMTKADFNVSGDTVGEACATLILGIDFSRLFHTDTGRSGSMGGIGLTLAESNAAFNALAKVENASYFVPGQTKKETNHFLVGLYRNECVTVHGRAVTIQSTK